MQRKSFYCAMHKANKVLNAFDLLTEQERDHQRQGTVVKLDEVLTPIIEARFASDIVPALETLRLRGDSAEIRRVLNRLGNAVQTCFVAVHNLRIYLKFKDTNRKYKAENARKIGLYYLDKAHKALSKINEAFSGEKRDFSYAEIEKLARLYCSLK